MQKHRKSLSRLKVLDLLLTHLVLVLSAGLYHVFKFFFWKVWVEGRENVPQNLRNTIILPTHQSWIDSWPALCEMRSLFYYLFHPKMIPWSVAEKSNFFSTWLKRRLFKHMHCVLISRKSRNHHDLPEYFESVRDVLKQSCLLIFFEGTRSRNGDIGEVKPGVAEVIWLNRSAAVPVRIRGMDKVWPVDSKYPKLSFWPLKKTVRINYGPPLNLDDVWLMDKSTAIKEISQRLKQAVAIL